MNESYSASAKIPPTPIEVSVITRSAARHGFSIERSLGDTAWPRAGIDFRMWLLRPAHSMALPSRASVSSVPEPTPEPEVREGAPDDDDISKASLRELVAEHLDFVWRSLRRFGVPAADVDDAAQQVFLIANEKSEKIRRGSERSFLIGVALRVASHARRAFERRAAVEQRFSSHPAPPNPDPEELAQRREARDLLDRVLDAMPEDLRAVFALFELEELSIEQIATILGVPR
jgi:RNA polymerase sigma-70 factor, ECF subfamily